MAKQALLYEKAVPISKERHSVWSVKVSNDYAFAKSVNSVPLTGVEFLNAADEYAIVFAGTDEAVMPLVILGVSQDQNLYVSEEGAWNAKYVPAFIRRYPFVFSSSDDGTTFTLCIDESFSGCNQDGRGERLFDTDGERTQYLSNVLNFLQQYQAHFRRTQIFCNKLKELDLLEPMQAQFTNVDGEARYLTGFMAISRDKLKALPDDKLVEMFRADELELAYLHLHSMRNFGRMLEQAGIEVGGSQTDTASAPEAEAADVGVEPSDPVEETELVEQ